MIELADLTAQRRRLAGRIEDAVAAVLDHGKFILGPEVARLEEALARRAGVGHAVTCASGSDALVLALLAWGVGPGDAVLVTGFTFTATAEGVVRVGAVPVFVDADDGTFAMAPGSLAEAGQWAVRNGLRPKALIPVDLFGQPADYGAIRSFAADEGLWVLADAAQSFGASLGTRAVGSLADATTTSFFPAKPLACYGDGGAVLTDDGGLAERVRSLRSHGRNGEGESAMVGLNSRLDTLQAAVLMAKLTVFDDELDQRTKVAVRYGEALSDVVRVPQVRPDAASAWAAYTVRTSDRDGLERHLRSRGVESAVYYRAPLHRQPAYRRFPTAPSGLPVAERLATEVLSLPIHPYLSEDDQAQVIRAVCEYGR